MDFLKELFAEKALTFEELKKAVEENGKMKVVNLKDGGYVDKDKYTAKEAEATALKDQVAAANKQIDDFKKLDVEGIKAAADKYKADYEAAQAKYQEDLKKMQFDFALDKALGGAKAKNSKAVRALLDVDKLKLDGETLLGLKEQLEAVKTEAPYLFEETTDPGTDPATGVKIVTGKTSTTTTNNPWDPKTYNMTEQVKIWKESPDKARALAAQHGVKL